MNQEQQKQLAKLSSFVSSLLLGQTALAENSDGKPSVTLRHSQYSESNMKAAELAQGDTDRYDIKISQLNVFVPINGDWQLNVNHLAESMSGASPWFNVEDTNGDVLVAMSGATIFEQRRDTQVEAIQLKQDLTNRFLLGYSTEDDYQARYVKWRQTFYFNQKNNSLDYSIHYSDDAIEPTQHAFYSRVIQESKDTKGFSIAWSNLLSKVSLWDLGFFYTQSNGFLTDPYKQFDLATPLDARPDKRSAYGIEAGASRHWPESKVSLHGRYRYYQDDWSVKSHTLSGDLAIEFNEYWMITFSARAYSQSEAEFYQTVVSNPQTDYFSMDYRLSSYGSMALAVEARWKVTSNVFLVTNIQNYQSQAEWGASSAQTAHPALVNFSLWGVELEYRF